MSKYDDTGHCGLPEIIAAIETRTDFDVRSLIPIYQAYRAVDLTADCSAEQLRHAVLLRLTEDLPFEEWDDLFSDDSDSDLED